MNIFVHLIKTLTQNSKLIVMDIFGLVIVFLSQKLKPAGDGERAHSHTHAFFPAHVCVHAYSLKHSFPRVVFHACMCVPLDGACVAFGSVGESNHFALPTDLMETRSRSWVLMAWCTTVPPRNMSVCVLEGGDTLTAGWKSSDPLLLNESPVWFRFDSTEPRCHFPSSAA